VFLSHATQNRAFATRLAAVLRGHKVPVWYSRTNLVGAQEWHDEIGKALKRCDWFIVILTPSATSSVWVKRELLVALQDARFHERILPVLYRPCDPDPLSWTLSSMQRVDFTHGFDRGCRDLLKVWGLGYDPSKR
jgi:hypothetical protein